MDSEHVEPMIAELRDKVDDLETALAPLLRNKIADVSAKLPLLDKVKLSVLTTYAIESVLFSVLKLNGVNAKEHAVFEELARVKRYFAKIHETESANPPRRKLDDQAANRFTKHALGINHKSELSDAGQVERKSPGVHKRFVEETDAAHKANKPPTRDTARTDYAGPKPPRSTAFPSAGGQQYQAKETKETFTESLDGQNVKHKSQNSSPDVVGSVPPAARSARRFKTSAFANVDHAGVRKKKKSNKPPRDGKTVFKALLSERAD